MLNYIQFQAAALLLMGITGALLTEKMTIRLHTQKSYIAIYLSVLGSIIADILSIVFIVNREFYSMGQTNLVCKLYLGSIVMVSFFLWRYTLAEVHYDKNSWHRPRTLLGLIPLICEVVALIVFPVNIFFDGKDLYSYGLCVNITYWCILFYLLIVMLYTIVYYKRMSKYVCQSIWFLIGISLLAIIIQMYNNSLLIASFSMSVSMIFMYIKLENPTAYIDNEVHVYNSYAYMEYLQKQFDNRKKKLWIASVKINGLHPINDNFGIQKGRELLCMIIDFIKQTGKDIVIYRVDAISFAIFYKDKNDLLSSIELIETRFKNPWLIEGMYFKLDARIGYLDDCSLVNSVNELMDVLQNF